MHCYIFLCICFLLITTAVPAPLNDDDSDSFDTIIIIVEAAVAALLLIIITLLIITLLFHIIKRRKMSSVTVKLSSQSDVIRGDNNTAGTSQQSLSDKDTLSQGAKVDSTSSLEILNDLYSTKSKSLDLLLQHDNNKSLPPSIVDCDVPITPNPSYAVPSETRPKSKHEYDYIIAHKPSHKEYLQLIGSTTSCNDAVTYPANDDDIINDLNPSHSLRQDSQDVTQEDFLPYVQMNAATK